MTDAAIEALRLILTPNLFVWLVIGVVIGSCVGIIPGFGGAVGMAILLPFLWGMEPVAGIFLLVGLAAVTTTSDAFPAILLGIPGTSASQATIMDGYPLTKMGQGSRALGAAFTASMLGGILGAAALFAVLPIARPLVLAAGSPELLMLSLVGLATVVVVVRGSPLLGGLSVVIGIMIAMVGSASSALEYRYTFDTYYLRDGVSLPILALGFFAIPELLNLLNQNRAASSEGWSGRVRDGAVDTLKNLPLVVRNSLVGIGIGMVPGVGGSVVDWVAWGTSAHSRKNTVPFGEGEIRGVIAPESAANSKDGGSLIPTLLFGIPGSSTTAVMLGAFVLLGIQPGPRLVEGDGLVLILSAIWALVLANILATAGSMVIATRLSKISMLSPKVLAPFLIILMYIVSYHDRGHWGGIALLLSIGLLGWSMTSLGIPRPPLLIGFILGPIIERYFWLSTSRYGVEWISRPGVLAIAAVLVLILATRVMMGRRLKSRQLENSPVPGQTVPTGKFSLDRQAASGRERSGGHAVFYSFLLLVFGWMAVQATGFRDAAGDLPFYVSLLGAAISLLLLIRCLQNMLSDWRAGGPSAGRAQAIRLLSSDFIKGLGWFAALALPLLIVGVLGMYWGSALWILLWFTFVRRWKAISMVFAVGGVLLAIYLGEHLLSLRLLDGWLI